MITSQAIRWKIEDEEVDWITPIFVHIDNPDGPIVLEVGKEHPLYNRLSRLEDIGRWEKVIFVYKLCKIPDKLEIEILSYVIEANKNQREFRDLEGMKTTILLDGEFTIDFFTLDSKLKGKYILRIKQGEDEIEIVADIWHTKELISRLKESSDACFLYLEKHEKKLKKKEEEKQP